MEDNGQLTFSDDPSLNLTNMVYQFIEDGEFQNAVDKLNSLMDINPNYPGVIDSYRVSKFWLNRNQEMLSLADGKKTADFLMKEWEIFEVYSADNNLKDTQAYKAIMKQIFFKASENYKKAFKRKEDTRDNFNLLLNLGDCFLRLEDYKNTIEILEYARNSYKNNSRLLSALGEAFFHKEEYSESLLYFKEAFFINPAEINLKLLKAVPILEIIDIIKTERPEYYDIRDWIPIYGFLADIFYVRRNLSRRQLESLRTDIYNLEKSYIQMDKDKINETSILPRLINKYLWILEYYEFQEFNKTHLMEIQKRLIKLDENLFKEYFEEKNKNN